MNSFFEVLKKCYPVTITQTEWETSLQDEEFLDDGVLTSCFQCMDDAGVYFITGNVPIFSYIEKQIHKASIYQRHYLEYAKNWLYARGIFEDSSGRYSSTMKAIICKNCGGVLGFVINDENIYPYFGYLDEATIYSSPDDGRSENIVFRNYGVDDLFENNENKINKNYIFKTLNENKIIKNYEKKKDLLLKLDNNKKIMNEMLEKDSSSVKDFVPILQDTLRALQDLDIILGSDRKKRETD